MKILVQKFGGTSVATEESRVSVYDKILKAKKEGNDLVVVVSAMGRSGDPYATDTLLDLIRSKYSNFQLRELDMNFVCGEMISAAIIASHLNDKGLKAIALNGQQAGIMADENHFNAEIQSIDTRRIKEHLKQGYIVVVTGGQAINSKADFTSLGRGGSDTSAVALANALGAYETIIYTDVVGIMSADPRLVDNAKIIKQISYTNCLKLAEEGAYVIHPRAVKEAIKHPEIKFYVRSTFSDDLGTFIGEIPESLIPEVLSITKKKISTEKANVVKITMVGSQIKTMESSILEVINENKIEVDKIEIKGNFASINLNETLAANIINKMHDKLI